MLRRNLISYSAIVPLALAGCATGTTPIVSLAMVKSYADDLIDALSAAAQAYIVQPGAKSIATVNQIVIYLQQSKTAIDGVVAETDARAIALQVVGFAQQLSPLVLPFLGPAGPFVPIAIAVLQAFIQSLPPPPAAPEKPPAELHRAALKYHAK